MAGSGLFKNYLRADALLEETGYLKAWLNKHDDFTTMVEPPAVTRGSVLSIAVSDGGADYTAAPDVTITGSGADAAATAVLATAGAVHAAAIVLGGTGYTAAPTVAFSGGGGTGAAATAFLATSGKIKALAIDVAGTGYNNGTFALTFTGGGGTGAAGNVTIAGGIITAINLTNAGSGYTSSPAITLTTAGGGSDFAASATLGFAVASITITAGGSGYTSNPTVALTSGGGTGATASASRSFAVASITVTAGGAGYDVAPAITFSSGAATATATVNAISNTGDNKIIGTSHTWKAGNGAIELYVNNKILEANGDSVGDPGSLKMKWTVKFFLKGDGPVTQDLAESFLNEDLVAFVQDQCQDAQYLQFGCDCTQGQVTKGSMTSGTLPSGAKGWAFEVEFYCRYFYNGELTLKA